MNKINTILFRILILSALVAGGLGSAADPAYAQSSEQLLISVVMDIQCGNVGFDFTIENGSPPFLVMMDFGDGDSSGVLDLAENKASFNHQYLDQGDFTWNFHVMETSDGGASGLLSEVLSLTGPQVTLSSSPFPPLFVAGEAGHVEFFTTVDGDASSYTFSWDLDGDGKFDGGSDPTANFDYTEVGKYYPQVLVTDSCGFTATDTMPVVVADPDNACHPTAQKIADGVNTIFPDQAGDLYTCEDVYALFDNESEENNLGFGRMWKAYHLAESMEELTWEDILDWHLNQGGWGSLLQLDRFADLLESHDLPELMGLVMSPDYSLGDVRMAVRSVTRYEADFEDALARILEGATAGELGQFYKLAADLDADVAVLDQYLADGLTIAELQHTSKFADRMEVDWTEVADARSEADSWGDINQAYRLATDEVSAAEILIIGVQEYKESLRGDAKAEKEDQKVRQQEEKTQQTAEKLAEQYSAEFGDVLNLLNGECAGEWACVRKALRDQERELADGFSEKDMQTALQIASKYGFTQEEVLAYHQDYCGGDWACTRSYFREQSMSTKETGKPEK